MVTNSDIRISVEFWQHHKTVKLERRLGLYAVKALTVLWMWVAQNRPGGNLTGMDDEAIEIAAGWNDAGTLIPVLVDLKWLDGIEGERIIHDWLDHNPWAADAENRSDAARLTRIAKTHPDLYQQLTQAGRKGISKSELRALTQSQRDVNAALASPQRDVNVTLTERKRDVHATLSERQRDVNAALTPAPAPAPEPVPEPEPEPKESRPQNTNRAKRVCDTAIPPAEKSPPAGEGARESGKGNGYPAEFEAFWAEYPRKVEKDKACRCWRAEIKRGAKPEELVRAARNYAKYCRVNASESRYIKHGATFLGSDKPWLEYLCRTNETTPNVQPPPMGNDYNSIISGAVPDCEEVRLP